METATDILMQGLANGDPTFGRLTDAMVCSILRPTTPSQRRDKCKRAEV